MPPLETIVLIGITASIPLLSTPPLAKLARAVGMTDRRPPEEIARKPRTERVAQVGGLTILLAALLPLVRFEAPPLVLGSLLAAFLVGSLDDAFGMRPGVKLALQAAVAALVCSASDAAHPALLFALALVAMNAFNTYDNADGAATSLAVVALAGGAAFGGVLGGLSCLWAAPLGFLWHNLPRRGSAVPRAYLGDAGSHLLGVLVALEPRAWVFLTLPVLDLARLAVVRSRAGGRPWVGDRRHLAHRMQARGMRASAVVGALVLIALPPLLLAPALRPALAQGVGAALTALLFGFALRRTPATEAAAKVAADIPE